MLRDQFGERCARRMSTLGQLCTCALRALVCCRLFVDPHRTDFVASVLQSGGALAVANGSHGHIQASYFENNRAKVRVLIALVRVSIL